MTRERETMILAHLMAIRSAIDAIALEIESDQGKPKCCDNPQIRKEQTYDSVAWHCASCGREVTSEGEPKAGSDDVSGAAPQAGLTTGG